MLMQSILKSFGYAYFDVRSVMLDSYLKIWLGTAGNATRKTNFESEIILREHIWGKICWYLKYTD